MSYFRNRINLVFPVLLVVLLVVFFSAVLSRGQGSGLVLKESVAERFPSVDSTTLTPYIAKARQEFWVRLYGRKSDESSGFAVRLLESPELFSSLFPGYPDEVRQDSPFWEDYFKLIHDSGAYTRYSLTPELDSFGFLQFSWLGCAKIFQKYGADIIIIGNSEVQKAIMPDLLSSSLPLRKLRILLCTTGGFPPEAVREFAALMGSISQSRHEKAKWVVWGISAWFLNDNNQEIDRFNSDRISVLHSFNQADTSESWTEKFIRLQTVSLSKLFPKLSWAFIFEPSFQKGRTQEEGPLRNLTPQEVSRDEVDPTRPILRRNETQGLFRGFSAQPCDALPTAAASLERTLDSLQSFSENIAFFRTPTVPEHYRGLPSCFSKNVDHVLQRLSIPSQRRYLLERKDFDQIPATHFAFPIKNERDFLIDENHENPRGAQATTQWLANQLSPLVIEKP